MAGYKDTVEASILDYVLANESPDFISFYLTVPTDIVDGAEVSGGAYARQAITLTRTGQTVSNTNTITFPTATADWGTVVGFAINTLVTGGTQVMYGTLSPSKVILTGETITIEPGQFVHTLD